MPSSQNDLSSAKVFLKTSEHSHQFTPNLDINFDLAFSSGMMNLTKLFIKGGIFFCVWFPYNWHRVWDVLIHSQRSFFAQKCALAL